VAKPRTLATASVIRHIARQGEVLRTQVDQTVYLCSRELMKYVHNVLS